MRALGAVSPATARPLRELPDAVRARLDRLVYSGLIREGAPGTYYLFDVPRLPVPRSQVLRAVLFWFLVIIIPILVIQFSGRR